MKFDRRYQLACLSLATDALSGGQVLKYIEKNLNEAHMEATCKTKDQKKAYTPIPLVDWFDLVAGTSSGGILACAMNLQDKETKELTYKTMDDLSAFYDAVIKNVFSPGEGACVHESPLHLFLQCM